MTIEKNTFCGKWWFPKDFSGNCTPLKIILKYDVDLSRYPVCKRFLLCANFWLKYDFASHVIFLLLSVLRKKPCPWLYLPVSVSVTLSVSLFLFASLSVSLSRPLSVSMFMCKWIKLPKSAYRNKVLVPGNNLIRKFQFFSMYTAETVFWFCLKITLFGPRDLRKKPLAAYPRLKPVARY